jgi:lactoylglutathione lyase
VIRELRLALTVDDFDAALRFYRDALELETRHAWHDADGRGAILELPRATLELLSRSQADAIDRIETGAVRHGELRLAVQVDALEDSVPKLEDAGATRVHASVHTPWGDHNQRLETPDGRQLTVFQPTPRPDPQS